MPSLQHSFQQRLIYSRLSHGLIFYFFLIGLTEVYAKPPRSFKSWQKDLKDISASFEYVDKVWIEKIPQNALLMSLYPQKVSVKTLDWVGKGGHLFITLNYEGLPQTIDFLSALDLKPNPRPKDHLASTALRGAWPFPSNRPNTSLLINYLLTPWITVNPLSFEEGVSWFKGEIPPIAIDEDGQSLGYRVRYGRGTLTLFGDGDALSDQLRELSENRRFAQAIIWWISHSNQLRSKGEEVVSSPLNIIYVPPQGRLLSMVEEESFTHKVAMLLKRLNEWWEKTPLRSFNLYTHLKYILLGLISTLVFILYLLTRSGYWKHKIILRRK